MSKTGVWACGRVVVRTGGEEGYSEQGRRWGAVWTAEGTPRP